MSHALDPFIEAIADRVVAKLASTAARMVSQHGSPLGSRHHINAVRRRVADGDPEAGISPDGRRHYLSHAALQEELRRQPPAAKSETRNPKPKPGKPPATAPARDLSALERELLGGLYNLRQVR